MPLRDLRTVVLGTHVKGRRQTSGKYHVEYHDTKGGSYAATVVAAGTSSGLKLNIDTHVGTRIIDNVPAATTLKSTNAYFIRI